MSEQDQIRLWEQQGKEFKLQESVVILNGQQPCVFNFTSQKWQLAKNDEVIDTAELEKNLGKGKVI